MSWLIHPANDSKFMMGQTIVELRAAKVPGWAGYFADHHWLLIFTGVEGDLYERCDRWEIWQHPNQNNTSWGHLHKNLLNPTQGVGNGPSHSVAKWLEKEAEQLIEKIESSPEVYPFNNQYRYWPGPNSNTFAQWIVKERMKLGFRAFGKLFPVPDSSNRESEQVKAV